MKKVFTLALISLISFNSISQSEWEYETTKNGVKVYTGPKEGSKHKQCKAIVEINTTIDEFCRYITNPENYISLTLKLFLCNLERFLSNKPLINQVNRELGY